MDMKQLIELLGENSEAVSFAQTLEQNSTTNVQKINDLERKLSDVTQTRDKFKGGNTLIKELLGLEQVNEETINEFLSNNKSGKADEKLTAELENLKGLLKTAESDNTTQTDEYKATIQRMGLSNDISNSGVGTLFANEDMYKIGLKLIEDGATFEDGKTIYKNSDGTTMYNGSNPMTIKDKAESLKSNPNYAGLFKGQTNDGGGGTPPANNKQTTGDTNVDASKYKDSSSFINDAMSEITQK